MGHKPDSNHATIELQGHLDNISTLLQCRGNSLTAHVHYVNISCPCPVGGPGAIISPKLFIHFYFTCQITFKRIFPNSQTQIWTPKFSSFQATQKTIHQISEVDVFLSLDAARPKKEASITF